MAAILLRQHVLPLAGLTTALSISLAPRSAAAEQPVDDPVKAIRVRKPIYDAAEETSVRDIVAAAAPTPFKPQPERAEESSDATPRKPSPTDRLAQQVKASRLFLHGYAVKAEDTVNETMNNFMRAEHSFTQTVSSLAPPKESNEKLLPGGIYVLVAAMAGSIISRRSNIVFRALTPVLTGVVTAHYVVPRTTENVGNLIWSYEQKYPPLVDTHLRISQNIRHFVETGKAHSQMGLAMAEEKVSEARTALEDLIRKGK